MHKPSAILITSDETLKKDIPRFLKDLLQDIKVFSLCKLALKTYRAQKPALVFLDIESCANLSEEIKAVFKEAYETRVITIADRYNLSSMVRFEGLLFSSILLKPLDKNSLENITTMVIKTMQDSFTLGKESFDESTGLLNRDGFFKESEKFIDKYSLFKIPPSLILFGIDKINKIEEYYGEHRAQETVVNVVSKVREVTKSSDILSRFSKDEFALVCSGLDIEGAKNKAKELKESISTIKIPKTDESVSCSFGVTSYKDSDDMSSAMNRAATFMITAREKGCGRIVSDGNENVKSDEYQKAKFSVELIKVLNTIKTISLINTYKGVVISSDATILSVKDEHIDIRCEKRQIISMRIEKSSYINIPDFGYIHSKVLKLDSTRNLARLGHFLKSEDTPFQRKSARVAFDKSIECIVVINNRRYIGSLIDLSYESIFLYTSASIPILQGEECDVFVRFDALTNTKLKATLFRVRHDKSGERNFYIFIFEENQYIERVIGKREREILRELRQ
jgi:diguanylate cyclase (GGDEF)-like protein